MWEMAWFTRQLLATQGAKIENIYDLLPFADPLAIESSNPEEPTETDVEYTKRMLFENAPKTL